MVYMVRMYNEFIFKKGDYSVTELRCHIIMVCDVYVKEYPLKANEIEELLRFFENDSTSPLITNKNEN